LEESKELNIGMPVMGVGSFRLSAFCSAAQFSAVIRYIPSEVPRLEDLLLPSVFQGSDHGAARVAARRRRGGLRQIDLDRVDDRSPQ